MKRLNIAALFCGMLACFATADLAAQESVADFYHNHTLHLLVGYGSGSGYDVYARVLAKQFSRHLAGNPTLVVDNMPGAGGLTMMNNVSNGALRDGSIIAMGVRELFLEPFFGNELARYDPRTITWIGSMTRDVTLCFTWHGSGPGSLSAARQAPVLVGSTGFSTDTYFLPQLLNLMLGTKFKVILGYPDTGSVGIAMEHGELQGMCGVTYGTIKSAHPEWLAERKIDILLQFAFERMPDLPDVPSLADFVNDDVTRSTFELASGTADMAKPVIGPPDIPPDRVAALRQAFVETMQDPLFMEDAKRTGLEIAPIAAATLQADLTALYKTPRAIVQNVIAIRDKQ
jgi:tripartite-type tricarboxylate transporter receptor subunit TctC